MIQSIKYSQNQTSEAKIFDHLIVCDSNFLPNLSDRVDIKKYTNKIYHNAVKFEAWADDVLVGLVAVYLNDAVNHTGFITNVSVVKEFMGNGIALHLISKCLEYAKTLNMQGISLEVSNSNNSAIYLYNKCGFSISDRNNLSLFMYIDLGN